MPVLQMLQCFQVPADIVWSYASYSNVVPGHSGVRRALNKGWNLEGAAGV